MQVQVQMQREAPGPEVQVQVQEWGSPAQAALAAQRPVAGARVRIRPGLVLNWKTDNKMSRKSEGRQEISARFFALSVE